MASSSNTPQVRPVTSRSRGICRYYTTPRGCFAGDNCKFLHDVPEEQPSGDTPLLTPYDKAKRCRYFEQGFCKRGENCWFLHYSVGKDKQRATPEDEEDNACSICFDKPPTYGLLSGCSHIFCLKCIKQWRDPQNKAGGVLESGNTKKCPMCRSSSAFITPSSRFWKEGTEEKVNVVRAYKDSMARVPCKYFQKSIQRKKEHPICPYGKDCFYQHLKEDGTPFIFTDGVDVCMPKYRSSVRSRNALDFSFIPFPLHIDGPLDFLRPRHPFRSNHNSVGTNPTSSRSGGGTSRRPRDANVIYAARRLREVGRSLEMLNDAISEGATLENLNFAVEALRVGLGRLEGNADGVEDPPRLRRRASSVDASSGVGTDGWEIHEQQEDEVMERLELLADQMLASINALRDGELSAPLSRAETPPPPLIPEEATTGRTLDVGYDSDNDMPSLESVSDSGSEHSDSSEADDDDDVEVHAAEYGEEIATELVRGLIGSWTTEPSRSEQDRSETATPMSARFSTVVDRYEPRLTTFTSDGRDDASTSLEPPGPPQASSAPSGGTRKTGESRSSDAFTTDGRGRVISISGGDDESTEAESNNPATSTADNPAEASPGGGGLLNWISSIF